MRRFRPHLFALGAFAVACAAGTDGDGTTSTGGGVAWTTSTGGSTEGGHPSQGGDSSQGGGGAPSQGGAIADGGSSSDGGSGGDGGNGGAGGAASDGQVVLVAMGPSGALAARFDASSGWTTQTLSATSGDRPSVAARAQDDAIAVFRNAGALSYSVFDGALWSTPSAVGPSVTTRATPSIVANAASVFTVFHGDDFKHYFAAYTSSFNPTNELVGSPQSFGPSPASVALDGSDVVIAFTGNDGDLYDQRRSGGTWAAAHAHTTTGVTNTPALVALDQGADLLVVFDRTNTSVSYSTSTGGVWSSPSDLPDTFTQDVVSLAALPGGKAVAAFRGTNSNIYTTFYDPGAAPVWTTPVALAAATTPSTPAVAGGVGASEAELAYVDSSTGAVMHVRRMSGTWSAPASVGGSGLTSVAIAAAP